MQDFIGVHSAVALSCTITVATLVETVKTSNWLETPSPAMASPWPL
jgi:hypothetical protein